MAPFVRHGLCGIALMLLAFSAASGASPSDFLDIDLVPLIDSAARDRDRFAVEIPHAVTLENSGVWSVSGTTAIWTYTIQIPTAVSLSFHATQVMLPANATLTVRSRAGAYVYRAVDVHRHALWSRIALGDFLQMQLALPLSEKSKVALGISSFQAGYRGFGTDAPMHPHYARLKAQASATSNSSCVLNYECNANAGNTGPGQATVGLIIANLYQCSGTLLNDVPGDRTPYVLTARHCQNGQLGGGNPGAAADLTAYWDATTPCGQPLNTLYDPTTLTQGGAITIVEQQDAWLIQLDASPVVSDAYYAGFDATGGVVQGGYTIHHALSNDKQMTTWSGQAASVQVPGTTLNVSYLSNFWEVINATGNIGPGASGSGLFDQNNRLVGSLSLGRTTTDTSGYEACPANPPPVPNGTNGSADFTSLAAVWASTADTTSSTGAATLQQVLDPTSTGQSVVNSAAAGPGIGFTANLLTVAIGSQVLLHWSDPGATSCTASGGNPGDNWSGALTATGTVPVTESTTGIVHYGITCTNQGGITLTGQVIVTWTPAVPVAFLSVLGEVWATRPAATTWSSNVSPCSITGGGISLSNLSASGTTTLTEATPGSYTYTLSCGSGSRTATASATALFITPALAFAANANDRLLGEPLFLSWTAYADTCTPSGGAPNDGWSANQFSGAQLAQGFYPIVTTLGTYTYGLVCTSGPLSVAKQVTVTVENSAPYVTLTSNQSTVTDVGTYTLSWQSNIDSCTGQVPPGAASSSFGYSPQGSIDEMPTTPGTYTLTVTCIRAGVGNVTSAPLVITVTHVPPTAALTATPASVTVSTPFTLTWSSTNAEGCNASGGGGGTAWAGALNSSGTATLTPNDTGTFTFGITCGRGNYSAQAQAVVTVMVAPATTPPPSTGGSGGGGGLDLISLLILGALPVARRSLHAGRLRRRGRAHGGQQ